WVFSRVLFGSRFPLGRVHVAAVCEVDEGLELLQQHIALVVVLVRSGLRQPLAQLVDPLVQGSLETSHASSSSSSTGAASSVARSVRSVSSSLPILHASPGSSWGTTSH